MSHDDLLQAALELDPEERLTLAMELLESVERVESAAHESWEKELDRRAARLDCGDAVLLDGPTVLRALETGFRR